MRTFLRLFLRDLFLLFLLVLFASIWPAHLRYEGELSRLSEKTVSSPEFRRQSLSPEAAETIAALKNPGEYLAVYWLESDFNMETSPVSFDDASSLRGRWDKLPEWSSYLNACRAVWDDLAYFPVARDSTGVLSVSFEDSWMFERTYQGERGHEGTDIMPSVNKNGVFPVVSMTDGVVEEKGWLELGGYRIGIRAPKGAYFYYAHLDSYAQIEVGDEVKAGDLLGFMGDTGYGTEKGTRGKFPVHLHLGIYICPDKEEFSVNPYPALCYLKEKTVSFR